MKTWFAKSIEERAARNSKPDKTSEPEKVTPDSSTKEIKKVQTKKKK